MNTSRIPLRIVFYQEDGDWIAHCLEFDLVGDGATTEKALASLSTAIRIQIEQSIKHGNPRNLFSPADGEYFRRFAEGTDITVGQLEISTDSIVIEGTQSRAYRQAAQDPQLAPA